MPAVFLRNAPRRLGRARVERRHVQMTLEWRAFVRREVHATAGFIDPDDAVFSAIADHHPLTGGQWLVCIVFAAALLAVSEVVKLVLRHRGPRAPVSATTPTP